MKLSLLSLPFLGPLDRYIFQTIIVAIGGVLLAFLALVCAFALLEELQEDEVGYTLFEASRYVLLTLPRRAYELLPYVTFLGALIGLGILASHSELVVMRAAGLSLWRIFASICVPTLVVLIIGMAVGELLAPVAEEAAETNKAMARQSSQTIRIKGGYWYREGSLYMNIDALGESGVIVGIRQYHLNPQGKLTRILLAERGQYLGEGRWQLHEVTETVLGNQSTQVNQYATTIWAGQADPDLISTRVLVEPRKLSIFDLATQIRYMQREGLNPDRYRLAYWSKMFLPLSVVGLTLLALTFVVGPLREVSMGVRLSIGLLVGLSFKYLQDLFAPMSLVYDLHPALAVLIPIVVCWLVGAVGLRKAQ